MYNSRNIISRWLAVLLLVIAMSASALACPNCKEGMNSQEPHKNNLARGFGYSVIFMLSMPPMIMLGFGFAVYRACVKAKQEKELEEQQAQLDSPASDIV